MIESAIPLIKEYFTVENTRIVILLILISIGICLFFGFIKNTAYERTLNENIKTSMTIAISSTVLVTFPFLVYESKTLLNRFHGLPYRLFAESIIPDYNKPDNYNEETMVEIKNVLDSNSVDASKKKTLKPNIIAVQLESFLSSEDISKLVNDTPSVTPNFDNLKKNYSSGYAYVPTFGGGTSKTKFEFLTNFKLKNLTLETEPISKFLSPKGELFLPTRAHDLKKTWIFNSFHTQL